MSCFLGSFWRKGAVDLDAYEMRTIGWLFAERWLVLEKDNLDFPYIFFRHSAIFCNFHEMKINICETILQICDISTVKCKKTINSCKKV